MGIPIHLPLVVYELWKQLKRLWLGFIGVYELEWERAEAQDDSLLRYWARQPLYVVPDVMRGSLSKMPPVKSSANVYHSSLWWCCAVTDTFEGAYRAGARPSHVKISGSFRTATLTHSPQCSVQGSGHNPAAVPWGNMFNFGFGWSFAVTEV